MINHNPDEINRRFFKSDRRKELAQLLEKSAPCVVRTNKLSKVSVDVLAEGNGDDAPSLPILQEISSENNCQFDLDGNPRINLELLNHVFRTDPELQGKFITGYIQDRFSVISFTKKQILYVRDLMAKMDIFCCLDATGKVAVHPDPLNTKPLYYYPLVLPGSEEYGPLPIAEFLSDTHTVPQISYFLSTFNHAMHLLINRKVIIKKLETDFSLALITSAILSFNQMSVYAYLDLLYKHVVQKNTSFPNLTIIHICSTHMLKTVKRKCVQHCKSR